MKGLFAILLMALSATLVSSCGGSTGTTGATTGVSNSSLVIPNQVSIVTAN